MSHAEQTNAGMSLIEMIGSGDLANIGQDLGMGDLLWPRMLIGY